MRQSLFALLALIWVVSVSAVATAASIRVAQDGSGDFLSLFDGVAAAAAGDTVLVGPGEYTDVQVAPEINASRAFAAAVTVSHLTIIGDATEQVLIGESRLRDTTDLDPVGIAGVIGASIRVEGLTLRGFSSALECTGDSLSVSRVRIERSIDGIQSFTSGRTAIAGCSFVDIADDGISLENELGALEASVLRCEFSNCRTGIYAEVASTEIQSCRFSTGRSGVQSVFGAHCRVRSSEFSSLEHYGLYVSPESSAELYSSTFDSDMGENVYAYGSLSGSGNVLRGGSYASLQIGPIGPYDFHGNHILNSGGYSVVADSGILPVVTVDLSNNYWGTTDPTLIAAWILDNVDDASNAVLVDVFPIADAPIEASVQGFGSLKSRFANPDDWE